MRASTFVLALGSTLAASAFAGAGPVHADQSSSIVDPSFLIQAQADPYWRRDRWRRDPYYRPYYYRPPPPPVVYYPPPPPPPPVYYAPPPRPTFGFWIR